MTCASLWDGVRNPDCLELCGGGIPILTRCPHAATSVRRGFSPSRACMSVWMRACVLFLSSSPSSSSGTPTFFLFFLLASSHWCLFLHLPPVLILVVMILSRGWELLFGLASMDCLCIVTTKVRNTEGMNDSQDQRVGERETWTEHWARMRHAVKQEKWGCVCMWAVSECVHVHVMLSSSITVLIIFIPSSLWALG